MELPSDADLENDAIRRYQPADPCQILIRKVTRLSSWEKLHRGEPLGFLYLLPNVEAVFAELQNGIRVRILTVLAALLGLVAPVWADVATSQAEMIRTLFRLPETEWASHLCKNQAVLDDTFFENVEKRVAWGSGLRGGMTRGHLRLWATSVLLRRGDLSALTAGRTSSYRLGLIESLENLGLSVEAASFRDMSPELSHRASRFAPTSPLEKDLMIAFNDQAQVAMLTALFQRRKESWRDYLIFNVSLLSPTFFETVETPIAKALEVRKWSEALDFAIVADLSALTRGRAARYQMSVLEKLKMVSEADFTEGGLEKDNYVRRSEYSLWIGRHGNLVLAGPNDLFISPDEIWGR